MTALLLCRDSFEKPPAVLTKDIQLGDKVKIDFTQLMKQTTSKSLPSKNLGNFIYDWSSCHYGNKI